MLLTRVRDQTVSLCQRFVCTVQPPVCCDSGCSGSLKARPGAQTLPDSPAKTPLLRWFPAAGPDGNVPPLQSPRPWLHCGSPRTGRSFPRSRPPERPWRDARDLFPWENAESGLRLSVHPCVSTWARGSTPPEQESTPTTFSNIKIEQFIQDTEYDRLILSGNKGATTHKVTLLRA